MFWDDLDLKSKLAAGLILKNQKSDILGIIYAEKANELPILTIFFIAGALKRIYYVLSPSLILNPRWLPKSGI